MEQCIREYMSADHARLIASFHALTDAVESADAPSITRVRNAFERDLETHMESEDRHLFPLLEDTDATEVRRLWSEHRAIRKLVAELGVRADRHSLRTETTDDLVEKLRAHADRENELLYRRADQLMGPSARRAVLQWLSEERRYRRSTAAWGEPAWAWGYPWSGTRGFSGWRR